jgi:hypothetical protein
MKRGRDVSLIASSSRSFKTEMYEVWAFGLYLGRRHT